MDNYGSNSSKVKEDKPKVKPIAKGKVKKNYKGLIFTEDAKSVCSYILLDVLVPAIKNAAYDMITNGISMMLFGNNKPTNSSPTCSVRSTPYVSYNKFSRSPEPQTRRVVNSGLVQEDIIFTTRADAETVLMRMDEIIAQYQFVSIADYKELAGLTGSYTDNYYGWTSLRTADVVRCRDGYYIKLPRPIPIER